MKNRKQSAQNVPAKDFTFATWVAPVVVAVLGHAASSTTAATTLYWDPVLTPTTGSDGAGTWNTTATNKNWGTGTIDIAWPNTASYDASFGAGGATGGTVTLGSNITTGGVIFNAGPSYTLTGNTLSVDADGINLANATAAQTISSAVALTANQTWTNSTAGALTVGGNVSGNFALTIGGAGNMTLSGTNTYGGGTTVNGGTVYANKLGAFNGGAAATFGTGDFTVNTGASVVSNANFSVSGGYATTRTINLNGGTWSLTSTSNTGEYAHALNLTAGSITNATAGGYFRVATNGLTITSKAASAASTISTGIDETQGNLTFDVAKGNTGDGKDLVLNGAITQNTGAGSGAKTVTKTGNGTLALGSYLGNYAGGTTINAGTVIGGYAPLATGGAGNSFGIGAITVNNGATLTGSASRSVGGGSATNRIVNLNNSTWDMTYSNIGGVGGEYVAGINLSGGTVSTTATGTQYFRAPTAGLAIASLASSSQSTISIGIDLTYSSATFDVAQGTVASGKDLVLSGNISQNTGVGVPTTTDRSITKSNTGTLVLSGSNTYAGGTTISAGTLLAADTSAVANQSSTGTGGVALNGGTLSSVGSGATSYVAGTVTSGSSASAITAGGGTTTVGGIAANIGTLAVGGLALNGNSTLYFDIASASSHDLISDTGLLSATGAINIVVPTGLQLNTAQVIKLIGFSSNTSTLANYALNGGSAPNGYSLAFSGSELDLNVSAVPEPSVLATLSILGFGILTRRRRQY